MDQNNNKTDTPEFDLAETANQIERDIRIVLSPTTSLDLKIQTIQKLNKIAENVIGPDILQQIQTTQSQHPSVVFPEPVPIEETTVWSRITGAPQWLWEQLIFTGQILQVAPEILKMTYTEAIPIAIKSAVNDITMRVAIIQAQIPMSLPDPVRDAIMEMGARIVQPVQALIDYKNWLLSKGSPEAAVEDIDNWVKEFKKVAVVWNAPSVTGKKTEDIIDGKYDESVKEMFQKNPHTYYFLGSLDMRYEAENVYAQITGTFDNSLKAWGIPEEDIKELEQSPIDPVTIKAIAIAGAIIIVAVGVLYVLTRVGPAAAGIAVSILAIAAGIALIAVVGGGIAISRQGVAAGKIAPQQYQQYNEQYEPYNEQEQYEDNQYGR